MIDSTYLAALLGVALIASLLSIRIGVSVAIIEILLGILVGRPRKSHYSDTDCAVMGVISPEFTEAVQVLVNRVKEQEVGGAAAAEVILTGPQSSEAKVKAFTVVSDEPKSIGGTDTAPTPTGYFAASIGFCVNVVLARHAALHAVDFDSLETRVTGHWDMKGLFAIDGRDAAFQDSRSRRTSRRLPRPKRSSRSFGSHTEDAPLLQRSPRPRR